MNRRCITVLLSVGLLAFGAESFGQTAISPAVRNAATIGQAEQGSIQQFVQSNVAKIAAEDPVQQTEGRDKLVGEVAGDSATAAFKEAYAKAINDAVLPLAESPSLRTRINAAIVVSKVATRTGSLSLKPAALKFISDKADPVVLWGVKAHGALIPAMLKTQPKLDDPLLKGLVPAIKDDLVAPVMQEAYETLRLNIVQERQSVTPTMIKAVVPVVQDLLALRISLYQTAMPENPVVDTLATTFLVDQDVWAQQTAEQRTRTAQLAVDLMASAAARTASFDENRLAKDPLIQTLRLLSSAIRVLGSHVNSAALDSAALPVSKVDISMPSAAVVKTCDDLIVQVIADFPGVKRPNVSLKAMPASQPAAE